MVSLAWVTAQKMKLSIKDFFSKCDQICRFQRIWSYLLKNSLMENKKELFHLALFIITIIKNVTRHKKRFPQYHTLYNVISDYVSPVF